MRQPEEETDWGRWMERVGTYVLSLVLALVVWLIAVNEQNPLETGSYPQPGTPALLIDVRGPDGGLMAVQELTGRTIDLDLRAPRSSWEAMTTSDFSAYIDLSGLPPGEHIVPVNVDKVDPKVDILEQRPSEYAVTLEEVTVKTVPIEIELNGVPADGYDAMTPVINETTALISGLARQIDQVVAVRSAIELDGTEKSQVENLSSLVAIDDAGEVVRNVSIEPAETLVTIPVQQPPGRKEVAVRPDLVGEPASGYRLSSLRVEPSSVILQGSADLIEETPGSVQTSPFSLEGATTDFDRPVELLLPDGTTTVDGRNTVVVSATITTVEGGKTITQTPIIEGLAPEFEADVALDEVQVIISGPVPLLDSLEADDMFVILDLEGLTPGIHNIRPRVVLPTGVNQDGVIPETVEVAVTAKPTPMPDLEAPRASPEERDSPAGSATSTSAPTGTPSSNSDP